jgi:hypothetical protein
MGAGCGSRPRAKGERRLNIVMVSGSCKKEAVSNSSAVPPRAQASNRGSGRGQTVIVRFLLRGRRGSTLACQRLDLSVLVARFPEGQESSYFRRRNPYIPTIVVYYDWQK